MSDNVKITKVVHTTTTNGSDNWLNDEWNKTFKNQQVYPISDNSIWVPNGPPDLFGPAVTSRCYNRHCKNETRIVTELKLGKFQLKTYICEACLEDLAEKVKSELGIEEEELKDV